MVWPTTLNENECSTILASPTPTVTRLEHLMKLQLNMPAACTRLTGIMATVSPLSCEPTLLENMMEAGMNMARMNTLFDSTEKRAEMVTNLRNAARSYGQKIGYFYPLAVALDLRGPVIRTGLIDYCLGGKLELNADNEINLTTDETYREKGNYNAVYVNYTNFSLKAKRGQVIYIDNELLKLRVEGVEGCTVACTVVRGGELFSHKDLKMPGVQVDLPTFSDRDKEDISFAVHQQLDMIITSYVEKGESIQELRNLLGEKGKRIAIACKIQNMNALENLDELMKASDSVIIARQELGTDIQAEKLIVAQKNITSRAMAMGKSCGIMAQVFHSMRENKIPLRSEVMDTGNCVLDGVDYMLLSAETASGPRPVDTINMLADVLKEAESSILMRTQVIDLMDTLSAPCTSEEGVVLAAALSSIKLGAAAVIITTTSGRSAALMARFRPRCPVLAITRHSVVARQLHLYRGVVPLLYEEHAALDWLVELEQRIKFCCRFGVSRGMLKPGDPLVVISGWRTGEEFTCTLRHQTVEVDDEEEK